MNASNLNLGFVTKAGRVARTAAIIGGVGVASLASTIAAQAQTYVGDAYGAKISINATLIGVGTTIVDNPDLPSTGSSTALTNQLLNANVNANTGNFLAPTMAVLNAGVINTSTIGTGGVATSTSQINGLNLLPSLSLGTLSLGALVQADVISSMTTANAGGSTGTTQITNLRIGGTSLGNVNVASTASTTYYLNALGGVSLNASTSLLTPDLAQIVINEQTLDANSVRTTNALSVHILQGNALANGNITVASSTAGFKAAAAAAIPEAGTLTMAGMGFAALLAGGFVRSRRRAA